MIQKNYRSERHSNLGGVCAGIAQANGYSISLVRIVALLTLSVGGVGLVAYLLMWALMPKASDVGIQEPTSLPADPLQRSSTDSIIGGVCGGLSDILKVDANLVRVVYALLVLFAGLGLIPYIYAWIVLPRRTSSDSVIRE